MPHCPSKSATCALLLIVLTFPVPAAEDNEILAGGTVEKALASGEIHLYTLELDPDRRWFLRLDQLAVDIELLLRWSEHEEPWRVDSPIDRDGAELVLLPETRTVPVILEVRTLSTAGAPGRYRLHLAPVEVESDDGPLRLAALSAMTEAGRAWAAGKAEDRRLAAGRYTEAAELWQHLRQPWIAAQSLYAAAVLHRLLDEDQLAFERARQVLPLWQMLEEPAREADTWNEIGLLESAAGRTADAREAFERALERQQAAGDLFRQAATANNLCLTHMIEGEHRRALECYGPALERIRAAGDDENEAVALTNLGWIYKTLGHPDEALASYRRALELHRAAGRDKREAETLNNLAALHQNLGEPQKALDFYLQGLKVFRRYGDRRWEGRVLHNLGSLYQLLGDPERALVFYHQALDLKRQLGDRRGEAATLRALGRVELGREHRQEAREFFHRALELERQTGNRRGEAITLRNIGQTRMPDDPTTALELYDRALQAARNLGQRRDQGWTLLHRGQANLALGRLARAGEDVAQAIEIFRALGMDLAVSRGLYRLAEVEHAAGRFDITLARLQQAIDLFETQRAAIGDPDLQATQSGFRRHAYELQIELLMERYRQVERPEDLHHAFEISERARAWGLMELLRQAGAGFDDNEDPELRQQIKRARRQLHLEAERRQKVLVRGATDAEVQAAEAAFLTALAELEMLETRRQHPTPVQEALTAAEIQSLLEPGTALLEYVLGDRRSFLFAVTSRSLQGFELPPRAELEAGVRRLHQDLSSPFAAATDGAELARLLLAPALAAIAQAEDAPIERLVLVADGALHYLPFGALPHRADTPLLARFEVVHLPSASVLAVERRRHENRTPAPRWVAVLADPVFDQRDLRLADVSLDGGDAPHTQADEVMRLSQDLELPRLRLSRREAENIAALAPGETLVALDFEADRELVLSGRLADFQVVHFATHGVIDARYPALSGLALSQFDRHGRPRDGFLRLRDIYELDLRADLVVLSACRTALGKEVRGEGLVGLTRGFLHAGARRVVASLWSVPDRATAELMTRFYRAMVEEALTPAAALRAAQLSMLAERRWRGPHNWAGFVLVGDWR